MAFPFERFAVETHSWHTRRIDAGKNAEGMSGSGVMLVFLASGVETVKGLDGRTRCQTPLPLSFANFKSRGCQQRFRVLATVRHEGRPIEHVEPSTLLVDSNDSIGHP